MLLSVKQHHQNVLQDPGQLRLLLTGLSGKNIYKAIAYKLEQTCVLLGNAKGLH